MSRLGIQNSNALFPRNEQQLNSAQGLATGADAPWSRDDKNWFDAHPGRRFRARQAFPDETNGHPTNPLIDRIVVQQIAPGLRKRLHFRVACSDNMTKLLQQLVAYAERSECFARVLFELADKPAGRRIKAGEIAALIRRCVAEDDTLK
jgi:hypothetical protein